MEQPNNRQSSAKSASEKQPIRYYFDRCPPELTLNILQYADLSTLQNFANIKEFNDAALAKDISVWKRHIKVTLASYIIDWANTFPVNDGLHDMQSSLITRWQEIQKQEEIINEDYIWGKESEEHKKFKTEIQQKRTLAKNIFKELWSFIKAYDLSIKTGLPFMRSFIEQNFPKIFEINLTKVISFQDFLLYAAVKAKQVDDVKILLSMGANQFAQYRKVDDDNYFKSIFDFAIKQSCNDIVLIFIDHHYDLEFISEGLQTAICKENFELIEHLIAAGADVNYYAKRLFSSPTLHYAIDKKIEIMDILLRAGANPNAISNQASALFKAMNKNENKLELLKLLLDWGADVNLSNNNDDALLPNAIHKLLNYNTRHNRYEIKEEYMILAKLFIRNGANFNVKARHSEKTILEELQGHHQLNALKAFACHERKQQLQSEGKNLFSMDHIPIKTLVDYINTVGKKVQEIIKDSKIKDLFNDKDKRSVREKLIAALQYYTNPGLLSASRFAFSFSSLNFHSHSHVSEVQALLITLANLGEKATAQECYSALKTTLETCQKKAGYDPDGTLALLGELLLAKLKREIGKEALVALEAVRKQRQQNASSEPEVTAASSIAPKARKK